MAVNQAIVVLAFSTGRAQQFLNQQGSIYAYDSGIDARLQRYLGGPESVNLETVEAIIIQYQLFRQAGEAIDRATNPDTPYVRHLPKIVGCSSPYEYVVTVPLHDAPRDEDRTVPFTITSDVPLSYNQIQFQAAQLAVEWAGNSDTNPAAAGEEQQWVQSDMATVTAAARCI